MPILRVSQHDLGPTAQREVFARLEGPMLYPHNPRKQKEIELAVQVHELFQVIKFVEKSEREVTLSASEMGEMLTAVRDAPRLEDIRAEVKGPYLHGVVAGFILYWTVAWHELDSPRAQLTTAKKAAAKTFEVSLSAIENHYWKRNKCVAHLWAAVMCRSLQAMRKGEENPIFPCKLVDLPQLLALSEWFRLKAEKIQPKHSRRGTILRPGEAWIPDKGLDLPAVAPKVFRGSKSGFYIEV